MKKLYLILLQIALLTVFCSGYAFAAPNIIIDGVMNDWSGATNQYFYSDTNEWTDTDGTEYFKSYEGGQSGDSIYDVEMLGLYVSDTKLYIGLHTDFPVFDDRYNLNEKAGDFVLNFGADGGTPEAAFRFTHDGQNLHLELVESVGWEVTGNGNLPYAPYKVNSVDQSITFTNAGTYIADDPNERTDSFTLEASVDLDMITGKLGTLLRDNTKLSAYWTMGCGNDYIMVEADYDYSPGSETPEPATFFLFGIGLIGLGAIGRKKQKA